MLIWDIIYIFLDLLGFLKFLDWEIIVFGFLDVFLWVDFLLLGNSVLSNGLEVLWVHGLDPESRDMSIMDIFNFSKLKKCCWQRLSINLTSTIRPHKRWGRVLVWIGPTRVIYWKFSIQKSSNLLWLGNGHCEIFRLQNTRDTILFPAILSW